MTRETEELLRGIARYAFVEETVKTFLRKRYPKLRENDLDEILNESSWTLTPDGRVRVAFREPVEAETVQIDVVKKL